MRGKRSGSQRFERGAAVIEMAIAAPLLALLLVATAEMGRAFYQKNTLEKGVRDAARYLVSNLYQGQTNIIIGANLNNARNLVLCGKFACGVNDEYLTGLSLSTIYVRRLDGADSNDSSLNTTLNGVASSLSCDNGSFGIAAGDIDKYIIVCAEYTFNPAVVTNLLPTPIVLNATAVMRVLNGGPS